MAPGIDSLPYIAMLTPVLRYCAKCREAFFVSLVEGAGLRCVFRRMHPAPTAHGLARLLGVALDPFAPVLPPALDIFVWHVTIQKSIRRRGNRTINKQRGREDRATVAGKGFEPLTFGL